MTFSEKLYILRKRKGLSQEQLAEILDVSRQSVSKWESQQALPETMKVVAIANLFQVSIDLLLKEEQCIEPEESLEISVKKEECEMGENVSEVMYCTQCGKENKIDSLFCGNCGHPFLPLGEIPKDSSSLPEKTELKMEKVVFPPDFQFKKYCANCGGKMKRFRRTAIAGDMYICETCFAKCSNLIVPQIGKKTISEVKYDIARMRLYPEFKATHRFGCMLFDANNRLWKAPRYPIFRFDEINDFEVMAERESESHSKTGMVTRPAGGIGGSLMGGVLYGVPGAIIGGVASSKNAITLGETHTQYQEYFVKLGLRIMLKDHRAPSVSVNFMRGRALVANCQNIVDNVNCAIGFLNMILRGQI